MSRRKEPPSPSGIASAPRRKSGGEASLVVVFGAEIGRRVPIFQSSFTIGRSSRCDLFLDQDAVSRKHAQIVYSKGRYTLYDQRSSNGTFVNDERITERALADGDTLRIGQTLLTFLLGEDVTQRYQDQIYKLLTVDFVTGVHNKRYFHEALDREHARALRYPSPLSLVLFDLDGVARLREEGGAAGFDALVGAVARAIHEKLRRQDIIGRLGDAAFAILFPEIDQPGARIAAEKVRAIVQSTSIERDGKRLSGSASFGLAALGKGQGTSDDLLRAATAALSEAKARGGNRVVFAPEGACRP